MRMQTFTHTAQKPALRRETRISYRPFANIQYGTFVYPHFARIRYLGSFLLQFPGGLPPQGLSAASMAAAAAGVGLPPGLHAPPGGAAPARLDLPPSVSLAQLSSAAPGVRPEHPPPPPPSAGPPNSGPDSKVRLLGSGQAFNTLLTLRCYTIFVSHYKVAD